MKLIVFLSIIVAATALTNVSPVSYTAWLSAAPGVTTSAIGACVIQFDNTAMMLQVACHHNISTATGVFAAHIHGPVANPSTGSAPPWIFMNITAYGPNSVHFMASVTTYQICNISLGMTYINVHTTNGGGSNGLIRGPVVAVGGNTGYTHAAILDDVQAGVTTQVMNSGVGLVRRVGSNIWVDLFHSLVTYPSIGEHIHITGTGNICYSICGAGSTQYPTPAVNCSLIDSNDVVNRGFPEPSALVSSLDGGQLYFNVHTATYQGGQIKGQIMMAAAPSGLQCKANTASLAQASFALVALLAAITALLH